MSGWMDASRPHKRSGTELGCRPREGAPSALPPPSGRVAASLIPKMRARRHRSSNWGYPPMQMPSKAALPGRASVGGGAWRLWPEGSNSGAPGLTTDMPISMGCQNSPGQQQSRGRCVSQSASSSAVSTRQKLAQGEIKGTSGRDGRGPERACMANSALRFQPETLAMIAVAMALNVRQPQVKVL